MKDEKEKMVENILSCIDEKDCKVFVRGVKDYLLKFDSYWKVRDVIFNTNDVFSIVCYHDNLITIILKD